MTMRLVSVAVMAIALAACGGGGETGKTTSDTKAVAAPAGTSWSETTATTAWGGMVMGNPAAAVKLIEYGSLTCPVCAGFSNDSKSELRALVDKGTLSFEFRPFLVHGAQDLPPTLIARCNGAGTFFALSEQLFAAQQTWLTKLNTITPEEGRAFSTMKPVDGVNFLAGKMELVPFAQQRGISADKAKACLSDPQAIDALAKMSAKAGTEEEVSGTPTFFINDEKAEGAITWGQLKPRLIEAGA